MKNAKTAPRATAPPTTFQRTGRTTSPPRTAAATRTSATEDFASLPDRPVRPGRLVAELPARSVTTFVLEGVFLTAGE